MAHVHASQAELGARKSSRSEALTEARGRRSLTLSGLGAAGAVQVGRGTAVRLGTKAESLGRVGPLLSTAQCLPQYAFTVKEWREDPQRVLGEICARFPDRELAVRSSARTEDTPESSNAGSYASLLNVPPIHPRIRAAIDVVVASYGPLVACNDQVLIQPSLTGVVHCGVLFSFTLDGAPYYVVNVESTGATDGVTSGTAEGALVHHVHRDADAPAEPPYLAPALELARDLERLLDAGGLDVEFAIDEEGIVYLLQVRPMAVIARRQVRRDAAVFSHARAAVAGLICAAPGVAGQRTILSDMADWNPAELVGGHPRHLALTLFHYTVTSEAWRTARAQLGYYDPPDTQLLSSVAGHPFIDVRASLNSLLPASLPAEVREHVVDEALDHLEANPHLHDKIEFDVAPTAYTPAFRTWEARYAGSALGSDGIALLRASLLTQTEALIRGNFRTLGELTAELHAMDVARERILRAHPDAAELWIARYLIDDCRRRGAPAFGSMARLAFVANALLRSFVDVGAITPQRAEAYLRSLRTVASDLADAVRGYQRGSVTLDELLGDFGHLRPGTFDVASKRYDEDPEAYFPASGGRVADRDESEHEAFVWSQAERAQISRALSLAGFTIPFDQVASFIGRSVIGREKGKFIVSKNISDALRIFTLWGKQHGLSRDQISHLRLEQILAFEGLDTGRIQHIAPSLVEAAKRERVAERQVVVPDVIVREEDLDVVRHVTAQPNFVGDTRVEAPTVFLAPRDAGVDVTGRIVVIESADPGYDWILGRGIAGLVTKYGGAASHMSIRCAEFDLPAAIGVGARFAALKAASRIGLDPANRRIEVIS